jgi:hypothetical protein
MRILITKKGEELTKELNSELMETMEFKKFEMTAKQAHKRMRSSLSRISSKSKSGRSTPNKSFKQNKSRSFVKSQKEREKERDAEEYRSEGMEKDLQDSKKILIKQKKIHIPKNVTEKYNEEERQGLILPDLTINLTINNEKNTNKLGKNNYESFFNRKNKTYNDTNMQMQYVSDVKPRNKYLLKEIIQPQTYTNLKNKLQKEQIIQDKCSKIDESKFRSTYGELNKVQQLDKLLDNPINSNKISLMKYINQKKDLSNTFIKKIVECSEEKRSKANKICQIIYHNKDKWNIVNERIKEKIEDKKNKDDSKYKNELKQMGETLKDFSSIISEYKFSDNKRERYREMHKQIEKKYWKKFNIDRLLIRDDRCKSNLRKFEGINSRMSKTSTAGFNF